METSRRDFLKGAGVLAASAAAMAGLSMTGCAAEEPAATYETKYTCDVVIAGGGIGGLAAAVSAVEAGANVILVEASGKVGGTSRFAAGAFGPRFGTDWEAAYAKAPMSDVELGKIVVEGWDPYVEWIEGLGLTIEPLGQGAYVWMGGERQGQGSKSFTDEYLQQFGQIFTDKGGTTLVSTRAVKILTDDKGAAIGLRVQDANGVYEIAAKSVILATGGWQCDKEMLTKYISRHADLAQAQCVPYLDGSGIKMGVEVGAQLSRSFGSFYGHPQPWPVNYLNGIDTPAGYEALENVDEAHVMYYGTTEHSIQGMGVYLNMDGKRFVNEGLGSSLVNQEVMQQQYCRAYLILDQAQRDIIAATPFFVAAVIGGDRIDNMKAKGMTVIEGATIDELLANVFASHGGSEFNVANAAATIAEYNAQVKAGNAATMEIPHTFAIPATPVESGPFYAIPVVAGIMATFGGLKINTDCAVMSTAGTPIANLYAVPGAAGGIMNGDYWCVMSGYSVLGKLAGANAAANGAAATA
ncbi:MAG: FAD-binding protein [Eggerthellaceae bacterium]|nr:FAD-binding protein [Eggerthellaceae bacterium]